MIISKDRWNNTKKEYKRENQIYLPVQKKWVEVEIKDYEISPIKGAHTIDNPWEGSIEKKPWDYEITAVIPCLETNESIETVVSLLNLQTIKPYILIIDTGSCDETIRELSKLKSSNLELHTISLNGVKHPSEYPAMAMDLAMTLCRTDYLFATHADVFLKKKDFLEHMLNLCKEKSPVVGYQLSPRSHDDWRGMVSHTASMYDMKVMDKIDFAWSIRKLCRSKNLENYEPSPLRPNWPDTEILGNYILRKNNIKPYLIGEEENESRTNDEYIDHFRSYTAAKLYSPKMFEKTKVWFEDALENAKMRICEWNKENYSNKAEKYI